jgi:hypothetical protein
MVENPKKYNSVVIVVPIKNESGNIREMARTFNSVNRKQTILVFSEGGSSDNSFKIAELMTNKYQNISVVKQKGFGKFDAVITVAKAYPDSLFVIWDGDHTVSYDDLCKCIDISENGKYFVYGNRLTKKPKRESMPFMNFLANVFFAKLFTFVFKERISDALCGTKVLAGEMTQTIEENKKFLKDTFGDISFFLAAKLLDIPFKEFNVEYKARSFGTSSMPRWNFAFELLRDTYKSHRLLKEFKINQKRRIQLSK